MLSIGEFSRATQLTIKALRLYHQEGLLIPDKIDSVSGYRYYNIEAIETAFRIKLLRDMDFSLEEIKKIISECRDENQLIRHMERKLKQINTDISYYKHIKSSLLDFIKDTNRQKNTEVEFNVKEEFIPDITACTIRKRSKYSEIGAMLCMLFRNAGRYSKGCPFTLYYDDEYKKEGADIEACVEVKKKINIKGIECRQIKGGRAITFMHKGPYEKISISYQKIYKYCQDENIGIRIPTREAYIKGPGLIFKGNPRNYLTKIIFIQEQDR